MKLVIGGCAQGKLKYTLQKYHMDGDSVWDGRLPEKMPDGPLRGILDEPSDGLKDCRTVPEKRIIIDHFHEWVKECLRKGECPEEIITEFLDKYPGCIIISDEVGNGIVPMDPFEREYRERLGRILIMLAGQADEVERIICGLGQRIK